MPPWVTRKSITQKYMWWRGWEWDDSHFAFIHKFTSLLSRMNRCIVRQRNKSPKSGFSSLCLSKCYKLTLQLKSQHVSKFMDSDSSVLQYKFLHPIQIFTCFAHWWRSQAFKTLELCSKTLFTHWLFSKRYFENFESFYVSFFLQFAAKFDKDTLFFQVYHFPKLQLEYHTLVNKTLLTNHTCSNLIPKREWFGRLIYLLLGWQKWCHLAVSPETIWLYHKYSHVGRTGTFITGSLLWHDSTTCLFHPFPCF